MGVGLSLGVVGGFAILALGVASCAAQSSDYTARIRVVPEAAARSLWIPSKQAKAEAAEEKEGEEREGESEAEEGEGVAEEGSSAAGAGASGRASASGSAGADGGAE
jgi:hypothetical protein